MTFSTSFKDSITTPDGGTVQVSGSLSGSTWYTPPPAPPAFRIGTDAVTPDPVYAGRRYQRLFAGDNLPDLAGVPDTLLAHPSITRRFPDSVMGPYFASRPTGGNITINHEFNRPGKVAPDVYRGNVAWLIDVCARLGGGVWNPWEIAAAYNERHGESKVSDWYTGDCPLSLDDYVDLNLAKLPDVEGWLSVYDKLGCTGMSELGIMTRKPRGPVQLREAAIMHARVTDALRKRRALFLGYWATVGSKSQIDAFTGLPIDYTPAPGGPVEAIILDRINNQ